jgi:hypothetical protein
MFERVAHSSPWPQWGGRQKPTLAHRLFGIGHPTPDPDATFGGAAQIP